MASIEEAFARLQALEDERAAEKQKAREDSFMDSYGGKFKNHRGLGMAILAELDRRGVDTSAADEAVQAVLDELREDSNRLLELIDEVKDTAAEQTEKIDDVADAVAKALAGDGNTEGDGDGDVNQEVPPMPPAPMEMGDAGAPPMGGDMPPAPPMEGDMPPAPPMEGGMPPAPPMGGDMPPAPPQGLPPTVSDRRMKRIGKVLSDRRAKRLWKPSAGMLSAATRGF